MSNFNQQLVRDLRNEYLDLKHKANKLEFALGTMKLSDEDLTLMKSQLKSMDEYSRSLLGRAELHSILLKGEK